MINEKKCHYYHTIEWQNNNDFLVLNFLYKPFQEILIGLIIKQNETDIF